MYRYKERMPQQTIKIIKEFFEKRGFKTECKIHSRSSKYATYGCRLELFHPYYKDIFMKSNGKGITKELCMASAYAELYERYCADFGDLLNICLADSENLKYSFRDMSKITYDSIEKMNLNKYNSCNINDLEVIFDFLDYKKFSVSEYINLFDLNDKLFLNKIFRKHQYSSNGFAAGNTFEEAMNQGISEIFERYISKKFAENKMKKYKIKMDFIKKYDKLYKVINNLTKLDYKLDIYDLSYEYGNYPVIAVMLYDLKNGRYSFKAGCFPIFEIALERCLTEIMQGFNDFVEDRVLQNTIKSNFYYRNYGAYNFGNINEIINPDIFNFEDIDVDSYNSNVFLDDAKSNIEIFEYWKQKIKINNDIVYYRDISKTKEIIAVDILIYNKQIDLQYPINYIKNDITFIMSPLLKIKNYLLMNEININELCELKKLILDNICNNIMERGMFLNQLLKMNRLQNIDYVQYLLFALGIITNDVVECEKRVYYIAKNFNDRYANLLYNFYNLKIKNQIIEYEKILLNLGYSLKEVNSFKDVNEYYNLFIKKYFFGNDILFVNELLRKKELLFE